VHGCGVELPQHVHTTFHENSSTGSEVSGM